MSNIVAIADHQWSITRGTGSSSVVPAASGHFPGPNTHAKMSFHKSYERDWGDTEAKMSMIPQIFQELHRNQYMVDTDFFALDGTGRPLSSLRPHSGLVILDSLRLQRFGSVIPQAETAANTSFGTAAEMADGDV